MTGSKSHALSMHLGDLVIGRLIYSPDNEQFSLSYSDEWRAKGFPLSPQLGFDAPISSQQIAIFLQNLLPENRGLDHLASSHAVSKNNIFALIKGIGLDTASAVMFLPPDTPMPSSKFRRIDEAELIQRLNAPDVFPLEIWDNKPRLSVAGVQSKLNLFMHNGEYGFGEGQLASTHIVKFETQRHLVLNEWLSMRLAKRLGFSVADVALMPISKYPALAVTRFDRHYDEINEKTLRRHMIDACQALGFPVNKKYERNLGDGRDVEHIRDGVSLPRLFSLAKHCDNPASAKQDMLNWVLFNLCINNYDAHGKNYSFFVTRQGLKPTPWYDLVNISLFAHFDQTFAMAIGDEFTVKDINAYQLAVFADECELNQRFVAKKLKTLCEEMLSESILAWLIDETNEFTAEQHQYVQRYQENIVARCRYLLTQADEMRHIKV